MYHENLSRFFGACEQGEESENAVKDLDLWTRTVSEIMSTELITIEKDTSIDLASILLLENNILQYHVYFDDSE